MATEIKIYANFRKLLSDSGASGGPFDFDTNTIKAALCTSTYTPDYDAHDFFDDITNECTGSGYVQHTLGTKAITKVGSGATAKYKCTSANATFLATGGSIVCRYMILYKDSGDPATSPLIACVLLDATPADVTIGNGGTLSVAPNGTDGWFYV